MEIKEFETESKELLQLMINSIYSNKEIFLRELISNASDAIDKYKYIALTSDGKYENKPEYEIRIEPNTKERTLTISDNGIGMTKAELINNLGTIARSGSKEFIKKFKEAKENNDVDIIGQFGVGFYSAFMVAKKIEVTTRSYKNKTAHVFSSTGESTYSIDEATRDESGTTIKIYLKDDVDGEKYSDFLETYTIKDLVKKYSNYVRYPIRMDEEVTNPKLDDDGKEIEGETITTTVTNTLNSMVPLWKKAKKDVTDQELNDFYKTTFYDNEDPVLSLFLNVEGMISYNALVYIPSHAPYDLYSDSYEKGLKLYSKGVFIKDKCKELVPDYLKFVKGLVDSGDLSLNISREILQDDVKLTRIRDNIESKIIKKLTEIKNDDFEKYSKFFDVYGNYLKFGIYSTFGGKKETLQDLLVYKTLNDDTKYLSLKAYKDEMKEDQKYIYYACGDSLEETKLLPELEALKKKGYNVLYCYDNLDEFTLMAMHDYDGKEFKNISEFNSEDLSEDEKNKLDTLVAENKQLLDNIKNSLTGLVDDVTFSTKLVDSPVCISTIQGISLKMEKVINNIPGSNEEDNVKSQKVLEINPDHELFNAIKTLAKDEEGIKDYASLLYDEAMLLEGFDINDKTKFAETLNKIIIKSVTK